MKLPLIILVLIVATSARGQWSDDELIWDLKAVRSDMPRLCPACDKETLEKDTVDMPYDFAGERCKLRIVFDTSGRHRESHLTLVKHEDYVATRLMLIEKFILMYGKPLAVDADGEIGIIGWPHNKGIITSLSIKEDLHYFGIWSFFAADIVTDPEELPRPINPEVEG